jgi:CHAT domain-containing protein
VQSSSSGKSGGDGSSSGGGNNSDVGGPVLVIADPVFSSSDVRVKTTGAGAAPQPRVVDETRGLTLLSAVGDVTQTKPTALDKLNIKRLPSTRDEANAVGRIASAARAPADIWLDLEASEANLTGRDMRRYRVIHFATHGLLDAERPQFTGLVLSLVGETKSDGFLRVGEVFNFRLGSPLVMLSACETGLGRERRGEGVIGLTRAFMYAGAPTVGVSLWSVADQSTALLMGDFYKAFYAARGTLPGAAMREAQLNMIRHPRYGAPYYWAPFVLVGDWL